MNRRPHPDTTVGVPAPAPLLARLLEPRTVGLVLVLAALSSWAVAVPSFVFEGAAEASLATTASIALVCITSLALTLPTALSLGHLFRASPILWTLCLLAFASCVWSAEPTVSLRRALLLSISLLLAHSLHKTLAMSFHPVLGASLGVLVILSVLAALLVPELGDSRLGWRGILHHKNELGFVVSSLATVLAALACWGERTRRLLPALGLVGCLVVLVPIRSSTAAIATAVGLSFVVAGWLSDHRPKWRLPALAIPLVLPLSWAVVPAMFFDVLGRTSQLTQRTGIWQDLAVEILKRPVLGYGYGMDWHRVPELANSDIVQRGTWLIGAHNSLLQVGFWLGATGTLLVLVVMAQVTLRATKQFINGHPGTHRVFPLAILGTILTTAITEDMLLRGHLAWVVVCYLAISLRPRAARDLTSPGPRRIALFLPRLDGGGAERTQLVLAERWIQQGHRVDLIVLQREGALADEIPEGVRVIELRAQRVRGAILTLARTLRRDKPDVLLACLNHANVAAVIAHGLAGSNARLALQQQSSLPSLCADRAQLFARLLTWSMHASYPWADHIVAPSERIQYELVQHLRLPTSRVSRVHNPIHISDIQEQALEPSGIAWLDEKEHKVVLAAGRLVPMKGFDILIESLARLPANDHIRTVILGEGEERESLQSQIQAAGLSDRVQLAGFVSNPAAAMARADLFVLPSRWEPFGNVLVEAMSTGTPVVAARCAGGPNEILESGRWGKLVAPGDPEALAQALADVLEGGGIDARARAQAFDIKTIGSRYDDLLFGLVPGMSGPRP
ncbi:MAG TPA: hypothetical protein DIU15_00080 [Deltaproteobacteria bacterium]|nr:hypothetical protein [Deltaproteobacteria bacterium]HCP44424.1 hypothetical protein [Deltaproteobacteria bacterium]